jgi:hypothetical protein
MKLGLGYGIQKHSKLGPTFKPSDLSGLVHWSEAKTGVNAGNPINGELVYYMEDLSGSGNHATQGTTIRQPNWQSSGPYINYDGGDKLEIDGVKDALANTTQGSWACHVRLPNASPSFPAPNMISFSKTTSGNTTHINMNINGAGRLRLVCVVNGVTKFIIQTNDRVAFDNVWLHTGAGHDGAVPYIFVDGVEYSVAQGNASYTNSTDLTCWFADSFGQTYAIDNGRIGNRDYADNITHHVNGDMDNVVIYDNFKTASEMAQLSNYNRPV